MGELSYSRYLCAPIYRGAIRYCDWLGRYGQSILLGIHDHVFTLLLFMVGGSYLSQLEVEELKERMEMRQQMIEQENKMLRALIKVLTGREVGTIRDMEDMIEKTKAFEDFANSFKTENIPPDLRLSDEDMANLSGE